MKAFGGSKKFKNELLKKALEHRKEDDYISNYYGIYKTGKYNIGVFKGCSVGCTIFDIDPAHEKNDHEFLATKLGVPLFVVHLQDTLFEGKSNKSAWTYDFLKSINVNSDLTSVLPKILLYIVQLNPSKESYFEKVVKFLQSWIKNGFVDKEKVQAAQAEIEAKGAGIAAIWAASEAMAAGQAANWAAEAAADTATYEEWSVVEKKIFDDIAEEFLRLIRECKPL